MRFGMMIGFAAGYYLGARAGRQRYEQLNRLLTQARGSEAADAAAGKARALADLGVERARGLVENRVGNSSLAQALGTQRRRGG
jgi:hypothetical protein